MLAEFPKSYLMIWSFAVHRQSKVSFLCTRFIQLISKEVLLSLESAIFRVKNHGLNSWETHERVKNMYSWEDVAQRTEIVLLTSLFKWEIDRLGLSSDWEWTANWTRWSTIKVLYLRRLGGQDCMSHSGIWIFILCIPWMAGSKRQDRASTSVQFFKSKLKEETVGGKCLVFSWSLNDRTLFVCIFNSRRLDEIFLSVAWSDRNSLTRYRASTSPQFHFVSSRWNSSLYYFSAGLPWRPPLLRHPKPPNPTSSFSRRVQAWQLKGQASEVQRPLQSAQRFVSQFPCSLI